MTLRLIGGLACGLMLIVGCSDDSNHGGTFTGSVCASVESWMTEMVAETNRFSDDSPGLSVTDRRARYAQAFDNLSAITDKLRDRLQQAPTNGVDATKAEAARTSLVDATAEVQRQIGENKSASAALPDTDYANAGVRGGYLFPGTEKAMSTVLKTLNAQGNSLGINGLTGSCGRR